MQGYHLGRCAPARIGFMGRAGMRQSRVGRYRIEGGEPNRTYVAWRPTGAKSFHVPAAFGKLVLK